jgi:CRP-like cAMP-binding protein
MNTLKYHLDAVYSAEIIRRYPKGQVIIYAEEAPIDVCYLRKGIVKVFEYKDGFGERIVHLIKPPALLPLTAFSKMRDIAHWKYTALTECEISVLSHEKFANVLQTNAELSTILLQWYSGEVHELMIRLNSLNKTNTHDKLIAALKFLVVHHAVERKNDWWRVTFPVNQQLLADLTGMTRESGATIMKLFKSNKIIRQPRLTILEINRANLINNDAKI